MAAIGVHLGCTSACVAVYKVRDSGLWATGVVLVSGSLGCGVTYRYGLTVACCRPTVVVWIGQAGRLWEVKGHSSRTDLVSRRFCAEQTRDDAWHVEFGRKSGWRDAGRFPRIQGPRDARRCLGDVTASGFPGVDIPVWRESIRTR